ncbi:hypothetical protein GCM10027422_47430 [Hymenobacter arcticus]
MLFRNRTLVRGLACFLLLETLTTVAAPSISLAMMGPGQPEFTSYEASGSPDLVNLTTGDFTYNIPVLDVPGPERGFSLPLTYRAGIKLEQEASWVGLGWSLNAGAIARSLTGYPDDADGELMKSTYNQKISRGWQGGVPGVLELGWDVNTGHSGSASLIGLIGLGWSGGGISSGSLVGVHADKDGVTANVVEMAAAAVTIATLGATGSLSALAGSAASQLGSDVGMGTAASVLLGKASSTSGGFNEPTVNTEKGFLHTNYWVFYNDQKSEFMYGSLHFADMSQRTKNQRNADNPSPYIYERSSSFGVGKSPEFDNQYYSNSSGTFQSSPGADLYQPHGKKSDYWADNSEPISIAHDDFSVMGGNISGSIRPYRLEVGSLSFPYQGLGEHHRFAAIPYLNDYKVPFRYDNSLSNSYTYHQFTPSAATTANVVGIDGYQQPYNSSWTGGLILRDPSLSGSALRTEDVRKGVVNHSTGAEQDNQRRLVQGKDIRWFTNEEILKQYQNSADGNGTLLEVNHPLPKEVDVPGDIIDYTSCSDPNDPYCQPEPIYANSTKAVQNNPWRVTLPGKGVGAFAITAEDGTTYHYSLPVYHYTQFSKSYQRQKPDGAESAGVSTQTIGPRNWDALGGGYATTWLLTAITSSDYVDRGTLGTVDDTDWGGWVRFDYGKFASAYKWRQPYLGESYAPDSYNDASFSEGYKETYYLNTIHTRSHTALFLKSVRNDARAHYQAEGYLGIAEDRPSSSLRLDEIVLLNNEDWQKLQTVNGIRSATDTGSDIPALFTTTPTGGTQVNPKANGAGFDAAELRPGDTYQAVLDQHDVDADSRIRAFLYQQAQKRVVFNYSYRLCGSTPNSFTSATAAPSWDETQFSCTRTGKLTLESLSTYGPASTKLAPDFKFTYGYNPDYQKNNWDGFGMYKSGVSVNTDPSAANKTKPLDSHQVSPDFATATQDGSAWSLTEITSPLGGQTHITYERDQYGKVSEYGLGTPSISNTDGTNVFTATGLPSGTVLSDILQAGDVLDGQLDYTYVYQCQYYGDCGRTTDEWCPNDTYCGASSGANARIRVTNISGNTITIDPRDIPEPNCTDPETSSTYQCGSRQPYSATLTIPSFPVNRNGGDLRVAAISTRDEVGHAYQVRYRYTSTLRGASNSSGVISKEPAYVVHEERPFDKWFDYPGTSVMYGKVSVLRGLFHNNDATDYSQAEEYTFQTPVSGFVQPEPKTSNYQIISAGDRGTVYSHGWRAVDGYRNATTVNLGMIGQPLAIRKLNRRGEVESSTAFEYSNTLPNSDGQAKQGYFTEGVLTNELLGADKYFYRINRSTKTYVPTVLVATTTKTNGISTRSQQEKYDFFTGNVVESSFRNYLGDLYRSKVVPAYTLPIYAAMGPSSEQSAHRNMLTQEAASYVYKVRPGGGQSVVTASVQTWSNNWAMYRGYDATADAYVDQADDPLPIWRLSESYLWNSAQLNTDGTYADASFRDFDWTRTPLAAQPAAWLKAGEFTRYDHYSKPLESKDLNGQYVSRKLGYRHTQRLVTAANARYTEVAYSGAEDVVDHGNGVLHFGGEVRDGGRRTSLQHHTGLYSTQLKTGETGFTYKAKLGSEVRGGQKYRLSCWVHQSDVGRQGQLYAQVDGQDLGVASIASSNTKQAGEWYLVSLLMDVPTNGQQLTVGCRAGQTGTTPVFVDDFRFQPVLAPTTAYVYDPATAQLTYVLDNDNLFTHYEHDAAGKVNRISKEVLTSPGSPQPAERRVKEYAYNFAQMPTPNWLPTGVTTWVQAVGGTTNQRQHEERDINPRSTSYNTTKNVVDGAFPNCATCTGPNKQWRNGICVTRTRVCQGTLPDDCNHTKNRCPYTNVYVYKYSDGTQSEPFELLEGFSCKTME